MPKAVIKGLKNILKHMEEEDGYRGDGMFGKNTQKYFEAIDRPELKYPTVDTEDYQDLMNYAEWPGNIHPSRLRQLALKYSIPFTGTLHRGLFVDTTGDFSTDWADHIASLKRGDTIFLSPNSRMSTTTNPKTARLFASDPGYGENMKAPLNGILAELDAKKPVDALPVIGSGQSELVVPTKGWKVKDSRFANPEDLRVKAKNYAKGGVVGALNALKRNVEAEMINAKAPQPGFFSTLDELIQQAPFQNPVAPDAWEQYLRPGRTLMREDVAFPLKAEELEYSNFNDIIARMRAANELLSKNVLLEEVRKLRTPFGLNSYNEGHSRRAGVPGAKGNIETQYTAGGELPHIPPQIKRGNPQFNEDQRLHSGLTAKPGSYEESVTTLPETMDFPSHFGMKDMSWSRTTRQPLPDGTMMRLIDEIQSDRSSSGNEKLYRAQPNEELKNAMGDAWFGSSYFNLINHGVPKHILEYNLHVAKQSPNPYLENAFSELLASGGEKRGFQPRAALEKDEQGRYVDLAKRVPDMPFKSPGDYGLFELKKQMLNSAYLGDDRLGIVPSEVQIERYEGGMDDRRIAGMQYMYDKINPGQLEKLARQYGAPFERVQHTLLQPGDARSQTLADYDLESPRELAAGSGFEDTISEDPEKALEILRSVNDDYFNNQALPGETYQLNGRLIQRMKDAFHAYARGEGEDPTRTPTYANLILNLHLAHQRLNELTQSNREMEVNIPSMKLTPEMREKIKRIGAPLWTLPAVGVGLEAALGEGEDEPKFAKGGVVEALKQLKRETSPFTYQRVQRVFDESPDLANIYSPRGVYNLATDTSPLIMLEPGEFRKYAEPFYEQPVTENGVPELDRTYALDRLGAILEEGGMADTPALAGNLGAGKPENFRVTRHEGRHRALAIGELLGNKVATHMYPKVDVDPATSRSFGNYFESSSLLNPDRAYPGEYRNLDLRDYLQMEGKDLKVEEEEAKLREMIQLMNDRVRTVIQQNHKPDQPERRYKMKEGRFFKEGGLVKKEKPKNDTESAFQRLVELGEKLGIKGSEGRRARLLTMAAANVLGQDQDGNVAWPTSPFGWGEEKGVMPGIIDATTQLAALPALLGAPIPEFAERASERSEQLQNRLRALAGTQQPQSFEDHFAEGVGSMLTQLPFAGNLSKAKKAATGLKSLALAPVEYLSPVVDPKAANYVIGGLGGAGFNLGLENLPKAVNWARENLGSDDPEIYLAGAP